MGSPLRASAGQLDGRSTVMRSPRRMVPGTTTRALIPRRFIAWPTSVFRKWKASRPNRFVNFAQPV